MKRTVRLSLSGNVLRPASLWAPQAQLTVDTEWPPPDVAEVPSEDEWHDPDDHSHWDWEENEPEHLDLGAAVVEL
ncbi:MAG: hypothetical protein GF320_05065 [Armatimonadia bacterium]|nr:hypothetical protein [Armatimonadia bacterium]